jgi:hypothetical protein
MNVSEVTGEMFEVQCNSLMLYSPLFTACKSLLNKKADAAKVMG